MSSHIPAALRQLVAQRAQRLCKYCLMHEDDIFFGCEVEHIISQKHGGTSHEQNLAYACAICNRCKGSDIASLTLTGGELCRLFNPRVDRWCEHFALDGVVIRPLTDVGDVTLRLLQLNHADRLREREALHAVGRFPTPEAQTRIAG